MSVHISKHDVAIVFGGGRNPTDGSLTNLSLSRLDAVVNEYKQNSINKIIVLGGKYKSYRKEQGLFITNRAMLQKEYLTSKGIPKSSIITDYKESRDTTFEAISVCKIIVKNKWKNILICTSVNHLPRAKWVVKRLLGKNYIVDGISDPPKDKLNRSQEKELLNLTKEFFSNLHIKLNTSFTWDNYYKEHLDFFEKQKAIHNKYLSRGTESKEAYASIHQKLN